MNVHSFIRLNQAKWNDLEAFVQQARSLTLARVPLEEFRRGSLLYRQTVADLGYARMRFPKHSVASELERLVGQAHSVVYQAKAPKRGSWIVFWTRTWPRLIREARHPILLATALFWIATVLGFLLTYQFTMLESFFVSPSMREAMSSGHLWTESITSIAPQAGSSIATNNISVSILLWALGLTFGMGTIWLLILNGLMLGSVGAACLRVGLLGALGEFIVAHGALELPALWIAAGAGLVIGQSMAIPGRYSRSVEMRRAGRRSILILIGVIPMLLIAAVVEAFVSPSDVSVSLKMSLALVLAGIYLVYILGTGRDEYQ